jgi:UPF0716 protein FxsA
MGAVLGVLVLIFLVMPFVELAVIVVTAQQVGIPETLVLLVVISLVGGWLMKREGLSVWRRAREQLDHGELPTREVLDGLLLLVAGALLLSPGFVGDALAILLLLPPSRAVVRGVLLRRLRQRIDAGLVGVVGGPAGAGPRVGARGRGGPLDVHEAAPRRRPPIPRDVTEEHA